MTLPFTFQLSINWVYDQVSAPCFLSPNLAVAVSLPISHENVAPSNQFDYTSSNYFCYLSIVVTNVCMELHLS